MTTEKKQKHPFVEYLERLRAAPRAMSALRGGLGKPPGMEPGMHRYIAPWTSNVPPRVERAYYTLAALYPLNPRPGGIGNLGGHLRAVGASAGMEQRFQVLLAAPGDQLHRLLPSLVQRLKSADVAVNWTQLLKDITSWDHPNKYVQRAWAHGFWGNEKRSDESSSQ